MGGAVFIVLGGLVIAFLAIFIALAHILKNILKRRRSPEQYRIAVVAKLDPDHPLIRKTSAASYRLVFRVKDEYLVFPVKRKVYESYHEGDKGELLYRKDQFISFDVTGSDLPVFEEQIEETSDASITFYGEAKQLGIDIGSDRAKPVTIEAAIDYYQAFIDDSSDWFFVLTAKDKAYLQVEKDEGERAIVTYRNGRKESRTTCYPRDVEAAITAFYRDHDRDC